MIASAVQRIWEAHRLQPHRVRSFKRSHDPAFAEKVEDIVGLYMSPPTHALVLSIDETCHRGHLCRSQAQISARLAGSSPALDHSLHPDLGFMA